MPLIQASGSAASGVGTLVFDSTLGADAAIIDTTAIIPATGKLLEVYFRARNDDGGAAVSQVVIRLNGSSGAVYDREVVAGTNVTVAASNLLAQTSWTVNCAGGVATAGLFSQARLILYAYAGTDNPKTGEMSNGLAAQAAVDTSIVQFALGFRSASAVNQVSIAPGAGTVLRAGSRLTVYTF